ncbi:uncharacterized protein LOC120088535 isoform X2 [Benincasa hispida]|uniref:uncharacterized protein LOC120088535 isoform X2 n=1 Tax=Benincasa hispida TaxID=102211 RepID=UPI0018FF5A2E|nr:uncharacterized protein LOC120088535 isoform X2 [Benincasa hispida]
MTVPRETTAMEMEMKKKEMALKASTLISISEAFFLHLICALRLALAFCIAHYIYSTDLISDPSHTLFLILTVSFRPTTMLDNNES